MAVHAAAPNELVLVWVDGSLVPRNMAKVSVFDSSVQGGDGVWEGVRVYDGGIFMLDRSGQVLSGLDWLGLAWLGFEVRLCFVCDFFVFACVFYFCCEY